MGCSLYELSERLPSDEIKLRMVDQMMIAGYTYDTQKQKEIKHDQAKSEAELFLNQCPWRKNKRR